LGASAQAGSLFDILRHATARLGELRAALSRAGTNTARIVADAESALSHLLSALIALRDYDTVEGIIKWAAALASDKLYEMFSF
jgi:hypothetical protein